MEIVEVEPIEAGVETWRKKRSRTVLGEDLDRSGDRRDGDKAETG